MTRESGKLPSSTFVHRGHRFIITLAPEGPYLALHLSDRYGRLLVPLSLRIARADVERGPKLDRRPIDAAMAEMRKAIEQLDHAGFRGLLNMPRAAGDFQWTPEELEAASRIDWSKPAATIVHEGYCFSIGAFETERRMVILLRDADGLFDAPVSIPRDTIVRAALNGTDPLELGVAAMTTRLRSWTASGIADFVRATPRLDEKVLANRQARH